MKRSENKRATKKPQEALFNSTRITLPYDGLVDKAAEAPQLKAAQTKNALNFAVYYLLYNSISLCLCILAHVH